MAEQRITETIEYLTQIHTAWDGTEQRMALRENPRRALSYKYSGMLDEQSQYLRALVYTSQTTQLEFPLWSAAVPLPETVYDAQSQVFLSKEEMWNYRDCHAAMLWQGDEKGGERFNLQGVTANGILRLAKQLTSDWHGISTTVVPVFWGVLNKEDSYSNFTSRVAELNINVDFLPNVSAIELPEAISPESYPRLTYPYASNAPTEYMGQELFMLIPAGTSDEEISYVRNANRLDNKSGVFLYDLKSSEITASKTIEFLPETKEKIQFLQRFFYRMKGQLHSFYAPTWTNDITLADDAPAGSLILYTKLTTYWKYYKNNVRRKLLIVFFIDGTIQILPLSGYSVSDDGSMGKIFLTGVLKKGLYRQQIRMISFLCKFRLASDTLTTDYETTEIANISLSMQEVDD